MSANPLQDFIQELKRRRVFRVATLYIVAFWPLIQIVDILSPALELPDSIMRYLVIAFIAGFPVALILAWIFDINKDGITVTTSDAEATDDATTDEAPLIGGRSELIIVAGLLVLVIGLFVLQLQSDDVVPTEPVPSTPAQYSVAVLPFDAFSSAPADEQFADGLTEELLNVLAHVKSLRVAARTSSFAYKGVNRDVTEIGRELNVAYILEGSVRRNDIDDTIRVTAQLVETSTGSHLFSKTYDRQFKDIFKIQDDISSSVVEELQITLLGDEQEKIKARSSANPEAMVAFGMGQSELALRNRQAFTDAIRFFEKAIELDPNYVDAYAGVAMAHALRVSYGITDKEESLPVAQELVDTALQLDPESGAVWAAQGLIHMQRDDDEQTVVALEKAMDYNPSHAMAHMWYAGQQESTEDKLTWYRKAYELDPRSPVIGNNIANILYRRGDIVGAMDIYTRMIESDPYYHGAYSLAAQISESRGLLDEAIRQYQKAYELSDDTGYIASIVNLYADLGEFDEANEWLQKINVDELPPMWDVFYDWLTVSVYASADRLDEARHLLHKNIDAAPEYDDDFHYEVATSAASILGDSATVISMFEKIEEEATIKHFNNSFRINAMEAAAHAYKINGQVEVSRAIAGEIEELLNQLVATGIPEDNSIWMMRAQIAALRDDRQMALIHLQRAIDEGWRKHWLLDLQPTFDGLKSEPAYQTMVAGLETRMEMMRERLALARL